MTSQISVGLWRIIRKAQYPKMRRDLPVGLEINHSRKRVAGCSCCGALISWDGKWRTPKRVSEFYAKHCSIEHVFATHDFDGSLAGFVEKQSLNNYSVNSGAMVDFHNHFPT